MASSIDPTKPTSGRAYTQDVRDNFETARQEISALQTFDSNLSSTSGSSLVGFIQSGTSPATRTSQAKSREIASAKDSIGETYGSDDTTAFQNRITDEATTGREILVNAGTLITTGVTLPGTSGQQVSLKGDPQTIIKAKTGATVLVQIGNDITRSGFREIKSLKIDGNGVSGVVGIKSGNTTAAALQLYLRSLDVRKCDVGVDLYTAMENSVVDVVCYQNRIGLKLRQDTTNGGGNANRFDGLKAQSNTETGVFVDGASALSMGEDQFNNPLIQSNPLCGMAFFDVDQGIQINAAHLENNGTSGTTVVENSRTIRRSSLQLNNSFVVLNESTFSETANPCIYLEGSSRLILKNSGGYGVTTGVFIEGTLADSVEFFGHCKLAGKIRARVDRWPDSYDESLSKWSGTGLVAVKIDRTLPNDFTASSPYTPLLQNASGGSAINSHAQDVDFGPVSNATFAASVGSTSSNRVTINALPTGVSSGDTWVICFLVKADKSCEVQFDINSGSYCQHPTYLDTNWRRVVMAFRASSSNTPLLYTYPLDTNAPTLYYTRLHSLRIPSGGDMSRAYAMVSQGLFNDNDKLDSYYKVRYKDDFLGDVLADEWNGRVGSDPQCVTPTILAGQARGVVRLVTGDDAGATMALNGVQLDSALNWRADQGGLVFEARIAISAVTNVAVFLGFTDQVAALEMPATLGAADALTTNFTDGVGVLFDTAADTDNWWAVGVSNNSDATAQNLAVAPSAGTFEVWRIEVSGAGVATFYRNNRQVGTAMTAATRGTVNLTPVVAAFSQTTAVRNIDVDYIACEINR